MGHTSLAQHSFKTSTRSSLARERKRIDDWKSRLEIATIVRVGVLIHHLRRGLILPANYVRRIETSIIFGN